MKNMDHSNHHEEMHMDEVKVPPTKVSDFIPLAIIFFIIVLLTALLQVRFGAWDTMLFMGNFMGFFFLIFGGFKIINWKGFVSAYMIYDIIAKKSKLYAYAYPLIELGLGVSYLLAFNILATSWVTFVVMIISTIGVANELRKKNVVPCACLGAVFKIPMTQVTLIEDLLMAGMALWMIITLM